MVQMINLKGGKLGCWNIVEQAKSRISKCGSPRIFWKCKCTVCGNEFEKSSTALIAKRSKPEFCSWCCPKPKAKGRVVVHYSGLHCGTRAINFPELTDNKNHVTCINCLKKMGRMR